MSRATSRITGTMRVRSMAGFDGYTSLLLRDGATAVHVHDHYSFDAQTTYVKSDGQTWVTFAHCGPEATQPMMCVCIVCAGFRERVLSGDVRFFPWPGGAVDPRPSKTFSRPVPGESPECPALNRVMDSAYKCWLPAGHDGVHNWHGVNEWDDSVNDYAPCQPIGCDNGMHLPGCVFNRPQWSRNKSEQRWELRAPETDELLGAVSIEMLLTGGGSLRAMLDRHFDVPLPADAWQDPRGELDVVFEPHALADVLAILDDANRKVDES